MPKTSLRAVASFCVLFLTCTPSTRALVQEKGFIDVVVTTNKGAPVSGLKSDDFSVTVGKTQPQIIGFESGPSPTNVGILLDNSGSLKQSFSNLREGMAPAIRRFIGTSNSANEYFVAAFSNEAPILQDWTRDPTNAIDQFFALRFQGATLLYDSIFKGTEKVMNGTNARNVLIVISDGQDSYSNIPFAKLRDFLRKANVTIYCIGLLPRADSGSALALEGQGVLDELATVTGGRALFLRPEAKTSDLENTFEIIATELRSQYRIAIKRDGPGEWVKVKVKATHKESDGKVQNLRTRHRELFYY